MDEKKKLRDMSFSCPFKSRLVDINSRNQFTFDFSWYKYNFFIDFVIHKIDNNYLDLVNSTLHALQKRKGNFQETAARLLAVL